MDRDRYLEIAVTCVDKANYLIYAFKTKPLFKLFFTGFKDCSYNEITSLQRIILILKTFFLWKINLCLLLSEKDKDDIGQIISPCVFISLMHWNIDLGQDFILDVYGLSGINFQRIELNSTL